MAGGIPKAEEGKKKARIEIIPLIDVIFFLLATFVLFTLSLNKIQSLPVQLPVARPPSNQKPDEDLVHLQVSEHGVYYWKVGSGGSEQIGQDDIAPKLENLKTTVQIPRVLITGDDRARFEGAVFALDAVRKAGIQQVSIETDRWIPTGK